MSFLGEIKRRKVFQVAAVYAVVAWLLIQVADVVLPAFEAPTWILQVVIFLLILGFPVALVLSWAFDLTPEGVVRDEGRSYSPKTSGRKIEFALIGLLVVAVGWIGFRELNPPGPGTEGVLPNSVAVLPFENLSPDPSNAYFAAGIHDTILSELAKIRDMNVIARSSVLIYADRQTAISQIAEELNVETVMEGTVQYADNRVRITAQLIDPETGSQLWSETYYRDFADIFVIQSEIAIRIAMELEAELLPEERERLATAPTENMAALGAYFLGKQHLEERTTDDLLQSIEYFQSAVKLDPYFALAYSGLADAYMVLPEYSPSVDSEMVRIESEAAANAAYSLDPRLPEALTSMAWSRLIHGYDWDGAEELLRRALEIQRQNLNALHWLSHVLSWRGEKEEALELAERAVVVDPVSPLMLANMSYIHMDAGNFERSMEIAPEHPDFPTILRTSWIAYMRAGEFEKGADPLIAWAETTGRDADAASQIAERIIDFQRRGNLADLMGELIARLALGSQSLPQIYAFLGDAESTLRTLEIALEERSGSRSVLSMRINPAYDFIRADPRFDELLRRARLN